MAGLKGGDNNEPRVVRKKTGRREIGNLEQGPKDGRLDVDDRKQEDRGAAAAAVRVRTLATITRAP